MSSERAAELESLAATVSDELSGDHRVSITKFDATTGNPATVVSQAAEAEPADFVRRALEHLTTISPALGLTATQAPEFVADPTVQETTSGARTVHVQQRYKGIPIFQAAEAVRFAPDGSLSDTVGSAITVDGEIPVAPKLSVQGAARIAAEYVAQPDEDEQGGTDPFGEPLSPPSVELGEFRPEIRASFPNAPEQPTVLSGGPFGAEPKASLLWFPLREGLTLAWSVTLTMPDYHGQYHTIVDADSGEVLYCRQLIQTIAARGRIYRKYGTEREMVSFPLPADSYPVDFAAPAGFPEDWVSTDQTSGNVAFAHLGNAGDSVQGLEEEGVLTFDPDDGKGDEQKVLNIFYFNCYMHDFFYLLGFREADGNFQLDNHGRGGRGGDPVDARAHSGAVFGTANMSTPVDGSPPTMNMGLVTSTGRHTAFDSDVVFHEFMHGVTNRLVGGPMNVNALDSPQSGGMGEGWGDYVACTLNDTTVVGSWVVDNAQGIRGFPYDGDFPDDFGALGSGRYDEVHNIGEIWCATLVELNRRIGSALAVPLVVDALKLSPPNPSFLNMRDAVLSALEAMLSAQRVDQDRFEQVHGGIWETFAKFGMGPNAKSNGAQLTGIEPDFETPTPSAPDAN
ncbi:MAG: M36 family metallopeptidase [Actinomycetota bacterium]|nr:M36 family metallopeptidase [Actinomycetota bacterium]